MSYILDALKKSDAQRKRAQQDNNDDSPSSVSSLPPQNPKKPWAGIFAGGFAIVAVLGLGVSFMVNNESPVSAAHPAPQQQMTKVVAPVAEPVAEVVPKSEPEPEPKPEPKAEPAPKPEPVVDVKPEPKPEPKPIVAPKPNLPPLKSAQAYVDRAWTSMDGGLYGQALNDLDLALISEPAFAEAWFAHGWANEKNGDQKAAVSDYNHAIDAKPDHAFALFSRGFLNLYNGNLQAASVDFVRTQGVAQDEALRLYSHLWLYIARQRLGQNARSRLLETFETQNLPVWPGPLVKYFQGTLDEQAVITAIETSTDDVRKERRATGYFFLGVFEQLTGNNHNARIYFEKTLATGAVQYRQYDAAGRELKHLNR